MVYRMLMISAQTLLLTQELIAMAAQVLKERLTLMQMEYMIHKTFVREPVLAHKSILMAVLQAN